MGLHFTTRSRQGAAVGDYTPLHVVDKVQQLWLHSTTRSRQGAAVGSYTPLHVVDKVQ